MGTPLHIALRYLFAKKKHNVINIISIISAAGIAIGSMALILILSVYNGFDNSIREIYESYKADFTITPPTGRTLEATPQVLNSISATEGIAYASPIVSENVFVKYGENQAIANMVGIDSTWLQYNHIGENIVEGSLKLVTGEIQHALIGGDLALKLQLRVRFITPLEIHYPKKEGEFSISNPLASINTVKTFPSAIFRSSETGTPNTIYVSAETARELTGQEENGCSYIEIFLEEGADMETIRKTLQNIIPNGIIKDKQQQNSTLYKMMKAEKFAVYLILFFVIAIISINIFSCLSMLMTDKQEDIATLLSMGATKETVSKIFQLHGFLISATGCFVGTTIGLIAAALQKIFGFISLPGNYIVSEYPVEIQFADVAITIVGVCLMGFLISYIPSKKFFKN